MKLPGSLDYVLFTHSNNDAGYSNLQHALQNALVIEAAALWDARLPRAPPGSLPA